VNGTAPTGAQGWLLNGYPKGEVFSLLSYAFQYSDNSLSHSTYQASDSGENA
jgi:hypothetical protein